MAVRSPLLALSFLENAMTAASDLEASADTAALVHLR
jgi:hypothetical protein